MVMRRPALFLFVPAAILVLLPFVQLHAQQAGTGSLKVRANPGRAGVFVDGKYLGPAANFGRTRTYSLPPGQYELAIRSPRHEEYKTTLKIEAGRTTTVSQSLQPRTLAVPPFGTLKVRGFEKFAPVYVNGMFVGHADEFNGAGQGLLLNPGDYDVKVASQAGDTLLEQKVTIRHNEVLALRAR